MRKMIPSTRDKLLKEQTNSGAENSIFKLKNSLEWFSIRCQQTTQRTNKAEDGTIEIIEFQEQKEKE